MDAPKPVISKTEIDKVIESTPAPIIKERMRRPSIHSAFTLINPMIHETLKNQLHTIAVPDQKESEGYLVLHICNTYI